MDEKYNYPIYKCPTCKVACRVTAIYVVELGYRCPKCDKFYRIRTWIRKGKLIE